MTNDACFICGDVNENRHQVHHIVPRRVDGSSEDENLVVLCASCHQAVEKMYDARFYEELGVRRDIGGPTPDKICDRESCTATADVWLEPAAGDEQFAVCKGHAECQFEECSRKAEFAIVDHPSFRDGGTLKVGASCSKHRTCRHSGCQNDQTHLFDTHPAYKMNSREPYCDTHAWERADR